MSPISLLIVLFCGAALVAGKKKDPVCVEPLDGVAAYPCESRPSKEPLSLQYSKAQSMWPISDRSSDFKSMFSQQACTIFRRHLSDQWRIQGGQLEWLQEQISRASLLSVGFVSEDSTGNVYSIRIHCSTFVCPTEIIAFSDRIQEFRNINTESTHRSSFSCKTLSFLNALVVAISVDSQFTHLGSFPTRVIDWLTLFSSMDQYTAWTGWFGQDSNSTAVRFDTSDLQRLWCLSSRCRSCSSVRQRLSEMKKFNSSVSRGLFIIDGRGILRQITMNDLPVGRSTDETLRLLQAFQYTDKHGEGN